MATWPCLSIKLLQTAAAPFAAVDGFQSSRERALPDFIYDRLAGSLREQGYTAQEVDAVVSQRPQRLGDIPKRLAAVRAFCRAAGGRCSLAAANKRVGNILKKVENASCEATVDNGAAQAKRPKSPCITR
jgi:glycyl-tRNA synthetase beta chain